MGAESPELAEVPGKRPGSVGALFASFRVTTFPAVRVLFDTSVVIDETIPPRTMRVASTKACNATGGLSGTEVEEKRDPVDSWVI